MEDRQYHPVVTRVDELVRVPARREWPRFGLAVTDDRSHQQIGVIERGTVGMREGVPKLAALVDRPGRFGRRVARNAAGKRELPKELLHAVRRAVDERIQLLVGAIEIGIRDHARPTVTGPRDIQRRLVAFTDHPVEVRIDEVESGSRAPVPQQPRFDVVAGERFAQQRVVEQIDLAHGEIVGGAPPRVDLLEAVWLLESVWLLELVRLCESVGLHGDLLGMNRGWCLLVPGPA